VRLLRAGNVLRPGHVQVPGQMPAMAPAGVSIPAGRAARSGRGAVEGYRMSCGARGMTGTTPEEAAMLDLYYWPTPNGCKVTILLHELAASYNLIPLDIGKGDQFKPEFGRINPNRRVPAIVDHAPADGGKPIVMFESGAILMYLAEK